MIQAQENKNAFSKNKLDWSYFYFLLNSHQVVANFYAKTDKSILPEWLRLSLKVQFETQKRQYLEKIAVMVNLSGLDCVFDNLLHLNPHKQSRKLRIYLLEQNKAHVENLKFGKRIFFETHIVAPQELEILRNKSQRIQVGKSFYQTLSHNNLLENFLQRLKNKKHFLASDFLDFSCLDELFKKSKEAPIDDFHAYLRKLGHSVQLEQKNEFFKRDAARMLYSRVYQEFRKIKKRLLTVETLGEYVPTPEKVVENMLHVANLKQGEKLIDLGSGDGRVCFMAAQKFGAVATGCEINKKLWAESQEKLKNNNLESQVKLLNKSIEKTDLKDFDVITLYSNHFGQFKLLEHVLASAKPGARVVAHSDYYGRRFFEAAKTICVEKGKLAPSFIHLWEIK